MCVCARAALVLDLALSLSSSTGGKHLLSNKIDDFSALRPVGAAGGGRHVCEEAGQVTPEEPCSLPGGPTLGG